MSYRAYCIHIYLPIFTLTYPIQVYICLLTCYILMLYIHAYILTYIRNTQTHTNLHIVQSFIHALCETIGGNCPSGENAWAPGENVRMHTSSCPTRRNSVKL